MVFVVFGAGVIASCQIGKVPPMLMDIREEFSMSLTGAAWLLAVFNVTGFIAAPVVGSLVDWLNHRRAILIGLSLLCFGSLVGSFAPSGPALLAARIFEGSGYLVVTVSAPGFLVRIVSLRELNRAFGLWGAFMPTGGALMIAVSPLVAVALGWRGLWQVNALLLAMYGIIFSRLSAGVSTPERQRFSLGLIIGNIVEVVRSGVPLLFALTFMSYAMMFLSMLGFLPTVFVEDASLDKISASLFTALALAANVPGNLCGGYLLSRGVPHWRLLFIALVTMALTSVAIFNTSPGPGLRLVFAMLFMGVGGLLPVTAFAGASRYAPRRELVSTSTGLVIQGTQVGLLVGPPVVAKVVSAHGSWQAAPAAFAVFASIGVVVSLVIRFVELRQP